MAYSINKVILVGNVGNDPEIKSFQNGNKVVNLSIATGDRWKDKDTGELKSVTEWHRVVIFNPVFIQITEKYIKKVQDCILKDNFKQGNGRIMLA